MYWIFLAIFIVSVLIPDLIRNNISFLSETRLEEIAIFLLGASAFVIFMKNEKQLVFHKKEKQKDEKKLEQTTKDLVESYSYIGEVNRKMDILMKIALGLSDQTTLTKSHENETYDSIVSAASHLFRADFATLRLIDNSNGQVRKEFSSNQDRKNIVKNSELIGIEDDINVKKFPRCLVVSSAQKIKGIRSYLILCGYSPEEENSPKNLEIMKVFASQALFLYSYISARKRAELPPKPCI